MGIELKIVDIVVDDVMCIDGDASTEVHVGRFQMLPLSLLFVLPSGACLEYGVYLRFPVDYDYPLLRLSGSK